jgi:hypothetical protein
MTTCMGNRTPPPVNIWALPKDAAIRVALLRLSGDYDLQELSLDCGTECSRQAIRICHRRLVGLSAYLFTHAHLEEIGLERLIELLSMHCELI